jgi:CHAD domain-containing protein
MQPQQESLTDTSRTKRQKRRLNVFPTDPNSKKYQLDHDDTVNHHDMSPLSLQAVISADPNSATELPAAVTINTAAAMYPTAGEFATDLVRQYLDKVIVCRDDIICDPTPESLHQMRVHGRRLRAVVELFLPALDLPKKAQAKYLKAFHQILGRARNCDVVRMQLQQSYYPNIPESEQQYLNQYCKKLKKQRKIYIKQIAVEIHQQLFVEACQAWLREPQYLRLGHKSLEHILPGLLLPEFVQYYNHPAWDINETVLRPKHEKQLHHLRKIGKQRRYQLEACQSVYGASLQSWIEALKQIQAALGAIEDLNLLEQAIVPDTIPTAYSILQEQRQQAFTHWTTLQQTHQLNPRYHDRYQILLELR